MLLSNSRFTPDRGWAVDGAEVADSPSTVVFAFGHSDLIDDPAPFAELLARFPTSQVVGCSTSGQIDGEEIFDVGLAFSAVTFERTEVRAASAEISDAQGSWQAGRELATALLRDDLRAVFVLSNGHCVNGSELARGLQEVLPARVTVTGGLAGDGQRFERTWVAHNGLPSDRHVAAVGFYGDAVRVSHGCEGGWRGFGPTRTITRAEGNVLYELDGQPALPLYKRYLGEEADGLPATALLYPLSVRMGDDAVVRTVLAVDEEQQSMTFAGDVPQGAEAQFMMALGDQLVDGAANSAECARGTRTPVLALAISCVGRRLILGERTEEELEAIAACLPEGSVMSGFYSYGELSPAGHVPCRLHNQTMTLTTIWEEAA